MKNAQETPLGWIWQGRAGRWPKLFSRFREKGGGSSKTQRVGLWGEWLALRHLRKMKWDIVARNWKSRRGEVDLIAYDGKFLVFVEVKTRRQPFSGIPPEEAFDRRKMRKLEALAIDFLRRHELMEVPVRFDLVAIETPDLDRFELRHRIV